MYPTSYLAIRSCIYFYIRGSWFESSQVAASLCASTPCYCCIILAFIYSPSHLSIHPSAHPTSTEVCGSNPVGWLYLVGHLLLAPATTSRRRLQTQRMCVRKAYIRLRSRLGQDVVSTHKRVVGGRPWLLDHEETHT